LKSSDAAHDKPDEHRDYQQEPDQHEHQNDRDEGIENPDPEGADLVGVMALRPGSGGLPAVDVGEDNPTKTVMPTTTLAR
jgi:hypothetical protein